MCMKARPCARATFSSASIRSPFQIALANAKATLAQTVLDVEGTKAQYRAMLGQIGAQQAQVNLAQITYNRYVALAQQNAIAPIAGRSGARHAAERAGDARVAAAAGAPVAGAS